MVVNSLPTVCVVSVKMSGNEYFKIGKHFLGKLPTYLVRGVIVVYLVGNK